MLASASSTMPTLKAARDAMRCGIVVHDWNSCSECCGRVVGWSIDATQTAALATNALSMAISNRSPQPGGTFIHSDHGTQFTSWAFTQRAHASGLVPSMGSVGDCADNALMESFWGRVQTELLNRKRWRTRLELANALFEYLEFFHNRQRRHSALGMLSPIEYELRTTQVA